jgi:exosortase H (IPTLxxWG-CTERM-specific)
MMKAELLTPRLPTGQAQRKAMLRFLGIFLGTVAVYYALTLSPWVDANVLYPVMKASAQATSVLLNVTGVKTSVEGVVIRGPLYAVAVRRGCDPLEPLVLFTAGVLAFPATWCQRLSGLAIGSALMFGINVVRIFSLYLLGARGSSLLESFHLWWWPAFFILCSLALWVVWLQWIRGAGQATPCAAPGTVDA